MLLRKINEIEIIPSEKYHLFGYEKKEYHLFDFCSHKHITYWKYYKKYINGRNEEEYFFGIIILLKMFSHTLYMSRSANPTQQIFKSFDSGGLKND